MNDYTGNPSGSQPGSPRAGRRRLARNTRDGVLGGVCAGLGDYFGVDRNLIRLLVVIGTIFGVGSLIVAYIAAWLLMPEH